MGSFAAVTAVQGRCPLLLEEDQKRYSPSDSRAGAPAPALSIQLGIRRCTMSRLIAHSLRHRQTHDCLWQGVRSRRAVSCHAASPGRAIGLEIEIHNVRTSGQIEAAFTSCARQSRRGVRQPWTAIH
jgi:hypothetical protein